jgi:hypothetical protein
MCITPDYDGETWGVGTIENRTARKIHRCSECGREIQPGERYEYVRGLYSDCSTCVEVRKHVFCHDGGFDVGNMWEVIGLDYLDEMGLDCLEGLSDAARDAMIEAADRRW